MRVFAEQSQRGVALGYLMLGLGTIASYFNPNAVAAPAPQPFQPVIQTAAASNDPASPDEPAIEIQPTSTEINLAPITPACPFPVIPVSQAAGDALFGEITIVPGERRVTAFERGDGSDLDSAMTVNELLTEGKLDEALKVAQSIQATSERANTLRSVVTAYIAAGQLDQALEIALSIPESPESAETSSLEALASPRDNALSDVVQAYLQAGQPEQAETVAANISEGLKFSTFLDVSRKYQEMGQMARAAESLERTVAAYRSQVATLDQSDDPAFADYIQFMMLAQIVGQYDAIEQPQQSVPFIPEMFDLAKALPQQDLRILDTLVGVSRIYTELDQRHKAIEILTYVLQAAETSLNEPFIKAMLWAEIAKEYAALNQLDRSEELLTQAQELANSETTDVSKRTLGLTLIAQSYGTLQQYDDALQVTEGLEPASLRDQVQAAITCSQSAPAESESGR